MENKIVLKQTVVVEGKYDKIALEAVLDATIIPTNGFGIFKNKEKMQMLRRLAERDGLVVLTDSDRGGQLIRRYLSGSIPPECIAHAYVPEILGKERRKKVASRQGLLGVEGMDADILRRALLRAGIEPGEGGKARGGITKADLFDAGLAGGEQSAEKRDAFSRSLGLPHLSANALLDALNAMMTRNEFLEKIQEMGNSTL